MNKHTPRFLLALIIPLGSFALAACATEADAPEIDTPVETTSVESGLTCTPGRQDCDYGCAAQGGPSTNDCIVRCNATGTGWITIQDCGWAQNFPYSSSCFPSQPRPRCEFN